MTRPVLSREGFPVGIDVRCRLACSLLVVVTGTPAAGGAFGGDGNEESVRLYTTREERRDAGVEHELIPGLAASGLLDLEAGWERLSGRNAERDDNHDATVQLGLRASPLERVQVEAVLELGTEKDELIVDEAIMELGIERWALALGRQYLPFGIYFNRFVTGPLLEFGETRATAATLSYELTDRIDVSASLYRGPAYLSESRSHEVDWVLAVEAQPSGRLLLGASYLDDLAETGGRLLEDESHRFSRKVSALGFYAIWAGENFEVSFEALGATRPFVELASDRNRPAAWNLEYVYFMHPRFDWALRIEGSKELEDSPTLQFGAAANLRLHRQVSLTLEILHGRFQGEPAVDDLDERFTGVTQTGFLLSVAF